MNAPDKSDGVAGGEMDRDPPDRARLGQLAEEQAALRRVATLVARGEPPEAVFAAVLKEVGQLLRVDLASLGRYEPGRTVTYVATWGTAGRRFPVGTRLSLEGDNLDALLFGTSRPVRRDRYGENSADPLGAEVREAGIRSAVGTPILVEGRLWGGIFVGLSLERPLPPDTEARLASFTELVANAESRAALARLAEEQSALRRVATLVARGAAADELFAVVAGEVGPLLGAQLAGMGRYNSDNTVTVLAAWGAEGEQHPLVPGPWPLDGGDLASIVFSTGQSVRIDDYQGVPGRIAEFVRDELGIGSSVASPIVAEGRLWGVLYLHAKQIHQPFPPDAESRLTGFTELVATGVLSEEGLTPALRTLARRAAVPVELDLHAGRRLPGPVEVAAYYAVSEAVANAAKHARASAVQVELGADDMMARLVIRDDGTGGADPARGSGLTGLGDRIEALGGTFRITSPSGGGTTLLIQIPAARNDTSGP